MDEDWLRHRSADAAAADAQLALAEFDDARRWFAQVRAAHRDPLAVEVWVFEAEFAHVLLVQHRWRGWVPPGGAVDPGELPREAAARELAEETGLVLPLLPRPAAVAVRSYHPSWAPTLGLSYVATADRSRPLRPEPGQRAAWQPLDVDWRSCFADDPVRLRRYAAAARENLRPSAQEHHGSG